MANFPLVQVEYISRYTILEYLYDHRKQVRDKSKKVSLRRLKQEPQVSEGLTIIQLQSAISKRSESGVPEMFSVDLISSLVDRLFYENLVVHYVSKQDIIQMLQDKTVTQQDMFKVHYESTVTDSCEIPCVPVEDGEWGISKQGIEIVEFNRREKDDD